MDLLTHAILFFQYHYQAIGGYAGFGALLAVIVQSLKVKWHLDERVLHFTKRIKLDGPKLVNLLLTVVTAIPFVADTLLQHFSDNPGLQVGNYAWLFATAVWAHRFAVSPIYGKIQSGLEERRDVKAKAALYDQMLQAKKAPTSVPVQPIISEAQPFDPTMDVIQG